MRLVRQNSYFGTNHGLLMFQWFIDLINMDENWKLICNEITSPQFRLLRITSNYISNVLWINIVFYRALPNIQSKLLYIFPNRSLCKRNHFWYNYVSHDGIFLTNKWLANTIWIRKPEDGNKIETRISNKNYTEQEWLNNSASQAFTNILLKIQA